MGKTIQMWLKIKITMPWWTRGQHAWWFHHVDYLSLIKIELFLAIYNDYMSPICKLNTGSDVEADEINCPCDMTNNELNSMPNLTFFLRGIKILVPFQSFWGYFFMFYYWQTIVRSAWVLEIILSWYLETQ
jgi:hypothetical protein